MSIGRNIQRGLTLTELLVALVAGLTVTSGVLYIYVSTLNAHTDTVRATRLEEELSAVMNLMVKDMQRAGYARISLDRARDGLPYPDLENGETNPFAEFAIADVDGDDPANSFDCILYSYDKVNAGSIGVATSDRSGFRLKDGTVDKRKSRDAGDAEDCTNGSWEGLTSDWAANITALTFTDFGPATIDVDSVEVDLDVRVVQIDLTGEAGSADVVERTLTETVRVRNDQLCPDGGC